MEGRISGIEDMKEETCTLVRENDKSNNNSETKHPGNQEFLKITNLPIVGIDKGKVSQLKGPENT